MAAAAGRKVAVAAVQFACTDVEAENVATAERLIREAHKKGAKIVLVQELFEGHYFCQAQRLDFFRRAKPYKGNPTIISLQRSWKLSYLSVFSKKQTMHIIIRWLLSMLMALILDSIANHTFQMDQDIKRSFISTPVTLALRLSKPSMPPLVLESAGISGFQSVQEQWHFWGLKYCFIPLQLDPNPRIVTWIPVNIGSGLCKSSITFYGNSFIAGPTGEIVKLANDKDEEVLVAEFDLDEIKSIRHGWGIFRDRRPELYKVLLTLDGEKQS
uniref:CN hydrolase domain-containing protein n=1 Tax=Zea mays TaxID=4577 RepID=A0A804PIU7_MAIZE